MAAFRRQKADWAAVFAARLLRAVAVRPPQRADRLAGAVKKAKAASPRSEEDYAGEADQEATNSMMQKE